jgi:predicted RecA/RadA family phage recombinase
MNNKIHEGSTLSYANAGGAIASGAPVVVGNQIGVAITDIAASTGTGELAMDGVFELPKTAGASTAINQGTSPIYDVSAGAFVKEGTATAAGDVSGAVTAWETAADGATTVKVKLNTGKGTVASA